MDIKIGIEPTFYFDFGNDNYKKNDKINTSLSVAIIDYLSDINKLFKKAYVDESFLEVPLGEYTDVNTLLMDFERVRRCLKKYNFVPRTGYLEGGCHINISFKINHIALFKQLYKFIENNKYISWYFLDPFDNTSCNNEIYKLIFGINHYVRTSKFKLINIRNKDEYLEFRFFEMPETKKELSLHIDFLLKLIDFILSTKEKIKTNLKTPNYCIEQMKELCKKIGIDYQLLIDFGKEENLITRFSYGEDYLN